MSSDLTAANDDLYDIEQDLTEEESKQAEAKRPSEDPKQSHLFGAPVAGQESIAVAGVLSAAGWHPGDTRSVWYSANWDALDATAEPAIEDSWSHLDLGNAGSIRVTKTPKDKVVLEVEVFAHHDSSWQGPYPNSSGVLTVDTMEELTELAQLPSQGEPEYFRIISARNQKHTNKVRAERGLPPMDWGGYAQFEEAKRPEPDPGQTSLFHKGEHDLETVRDVLRNHGWVSLMQPEHHIATGEDEGKTLHRDLWWNDTWRDGKEYKIQTWTTRRDEDVYETMWASIPAGRDEPTISGQHTIKLESIRELIDLVQPNTPEHFIATVKAAKQIEAKRPGGIPDPNQLDLIGMTEFNTKTVGDILQKLGYQINGFYEPSEGNVWEVEWGPKDPRAAGDSIAMSVYITADVANGDDLWLSTYPVDSIHIMIDGDGFDSETDAYSMKELVQAVNSYGLNVGGMPVDDPTEPQEEAKRPADDPDQLNLLHDNTDLVFDLLHKHGWHWVDSDADADQGRMSLWSHDHGEDLFVNLHVFEDGYFEDPDNDNIVSNEDWVPAGTINHMEVSVAERRTPVNDLIVKKVTTQDIPTLAQDVVREVYGMIGEAKRPEEDPAQDSLVEPKVELPRPLQYKVMGYAPSQHNGEHLADLTELYDTLEQAVAWANDNEHEPRRELLNQWIENEDGDAYIVGVIPAELIGDDPDNWNDGLAEVVYLDLDGQPTDFAIPIFWPPKEA